MSDDRQEPPAGDADATRAVPTPQGEDATRALPRNAAGGDADATQVVRRPSGGAGPDEARGEVDATQAMRRPSGDAGPDATRPIPGSGAGGGAWSGRAGVPPPRSAGYPEPGAEWYADEQAGRRWWMPILLGILALVLVALIATGVWWALRATENPDPGSSASAVPSTSAPASATPTSASPSSSPSTTPSSVPPTTAEEEVEVPMPPLVGLPEAAARSALDRLGIDYRVQRRPSDRPAGTVIATDPEAGYSVGEDDRVTLVVAGPAAPTTGAPSAGASTPGATPTATVTP
ncbi:PASTA domain-containing protein [Micromonospora sp. NBS 11-29]|uniref:PASTA domain-containing protein n=1 Tax=Micromonospora sp. NBS 11-29 TaxID=1960879 RepID=UPI000B777DE2|nr:PASTA domain-containing protein [Micromonospora sp. NBS 11-29]